MRWRIPLVAVLALFLAVSCDSPTTVPEPEGTGEVPSLAQHYFDNFTWNFDMDCPSETIVGSAVIHDSWTESDRGFVGRYLIKGEGEGETSGAKYKFIEVNPYLLLDTGNSFHYRELIRTQLIGQGAAPNYKLTATIVYVWANGEDRVDIFFEDFQCSW